LKVSSPKGISLIQFNIIVLTAFVVTAAVLNFGANSGIWGFHMETDSLTENKIDLLLDDIKNQFAQVIAGNGDNNTNYEIDSNGINDKISIQHNDICYEYYIDSNSNLVKSVEGFEKIVTGNVKSLKVKEIEDDKMIVTISSISTNLDSMNRAEAATMNYSTVIDRKTSA
jgi:hypothetical protein